MEIYVFVSCFVVGGAGKFSLLFIFLFLEIGKTWQIFINFPQFNLIFNIFRCLVSKLFDVCPRSTLADVESIGLEMAWGTGIAGHVAESGEPVNIPDAYQVSFPSFSKFSYILSFLQSFLDFPAFLSIFHQFSLIFHFFFHNFSLNFKIKFL